MNIVTYNMRFGGASKDHWQRTIEEFDPDIFLVQETFDPADHHPAGNNWCHNTIWHPVEGLNWGSAVYVKDCAPIILDVAGFEGSVAGAIVEGLGGCVGGKLHLFSVHAPKRGTYQAAVNAILDEIAKMRDESDLIIGGDFNLTIGQRHSTESLTTAKAELAIQNRLQDEFGLINCWQTVHPDEPLPQTLRWSRDRSVPYHCDGIFVPSAWSEGLQACTVISGPEWDHRSDHNPVLAELKS